MDHAERVAYLNGRIVPESEALISFRDSMALNGEGVYDTERTFEGRIFKLQEHLDRLWRSLAYLRIPPPLEMEELAEITKEVASRNYRVMQEDTWVSQRISRGTPIGCTILAFTCALAIASASTARSAGRIEGRVRLGRSAR